MAILLLSNKKQNENGKDKGRGEEEGEEAKKSDQIPEITNNTNWKSSFSK